MKLSINLSSVMRTIDKAIKEAKIAEKNKTMICYQIGHLMACKGILYALWPESSSNAKAYYLIEEKTKEIQSVVDEICRVVREI